MASVYEWRRVTTPTPDPIQADLRRGFWWRLLLLVAAWMVFIAIWCSVYCKASDTIVLPRADYEALMSSLKELTEIRAATPEISLEPIEILRDSAGRIYSKPNLRGSVALKSLSWRLGASLEVKVSQKRRQRPWARFFSCHAVRIWKRSDEEPFIFPWAIAGSIEFWYVRPMVYVHERAYGFAARIPLTANIGGMAGADMPGWRPRFGVAFRF